MPTIIPKATTVQLLPKPALINMIIRYNFTAKITEALNLNMKITDKLS